MKKSKKIILGLASSAFLLANGFFLSCASDSGDDDSYSPSGIASPDDSNSSLVEDDNGNSGSGNTGNSGNGGSGNQSASGNLPIIPAGANQTKVEGAGIWIYLDNTSLGISGANAGDFVAKTSVTVTDTNDNSPVNFNSFQFDDYGPEEKTVRLMVLLPDAAHNTVKVDITINANGTAYKGSASFKDGVYVFDFTPASLVISTATSADKIAAGDSVELLVTDSEHGIDITEDCTFEVTGENVSVSGKTLTVDENAAPGSITVNVTHKSGVTGTFDIEVVEAGTVIGINWNSIPWLGNGSGDSNNTDKYKGKGDVKNFINIQQPSWDGVTGPGIYVEFGSGISSCTLGTGTDKTDFYIQGAGILLYLSSFTQKETTFTITDAQGEHEVTIYYADGSDAE